jgi:FAD dependent oxidoreductase central domain
MASGEDFERDTLPEDWDDVMPIREQAMNRMPLFETTGTQSAGGAGMAVAQRITGGAAPFDLGDVDIRRAQPFQKNRKYLKDRVSETLGLLYADHCPRQAVAARGVRRSPMPEHLKARGAVFGNSSGGERANGFADGVGRLVYSQMLNPRGGAEIAGRRFAAVASLAPMYDPKSDRVRMQA